MYFELHKFCTLDQAKVAITCWRYTAWRGLLDRYIYKAATYMYATITVCLELYQRFISLTIYGLLSLQVHCTCNIEKLGVGPGMSPVTFCLSKYTHTYVHILSLLFVHVCDTVNG